MESLCSFRRGMIAALTAWSLFSFPVQGQTNPCDLDGNGTVDNADVALAIKMVLRTAPCSSQLEGSLTCTVITVQRVVNASLGQLCSAYNAHAANLGWTASATPNVTYNVYRASVAAGPFTTPLNSTPIRSMTYKDTTVQAGQTYYYVATAVAANGTESDFSSPAIQATIPTP